MQTTDERLAVIEKKTKAIRRRCYQRNTILLGSASVLCSLLLIICVGVSMPDFVKVVNGHIFIQTGGVASIFTNSTSFGFMLIGIVSFLLGVCVTLLCYHLKKREGKKEI